MRRAGRFFASTLALTLTAILAIALAVAVLVLTETGLNWAFSLAARLAPGELRAEHLAGRLLGPIHAEGLEYRIKDWHVRGETLDLVWRPAALFDRTLHIVNLRVTGLRIEGPPRDPDEPPLTALPDIQLPWKFRVETARITGAELLPAPGRRVLRAETVNASFHTDERGVHINSFDIITPHTATLLAGDLDPRGDYPLQAHMAWSAQAPDFQPFAGEFGVRGSLKELTIEHVLTAPARISLSGALHTPLTQPRWSATVESGGFSLRDFSEKWPATPVSGQINGKGDFTEADFGGTLRTRIEGQRVTGRFDARYDGATLAVRRLLLSSPELTTTVSLQGKLTGLLNTPHAAFSGEWQHLSWPLAAAARPDLPFTTSPATAVVASEQARFEVAGTLARYDFSMEGALTGAHVPPGGWRLGGTGQPGGIAFTTLHGELLSGTVEGTGRIAWDHGLAWDTAFTANGLHAGERWPEWPATVSTRVQASGRRHEGVYAAELTLNDIEGDLRGRPLRGQAHVAVDRGAYAVRTLRLRAGENRLAASGNVDTDWDVNWEIDAPDLAALWPGAEGALRGGGRLAGPRAAPLIGAALGGEHIVYGGDHHAAELSIALAVDMGDAVPSVADVRLGGARIAGQTVDAISLQMQGATGAHTLDILFARDDKILAARLDGHLREQRWEGELAHLDLNTSPFEQWTLTAPAPFSVSREEMEVKPLCLRPARTPDASLICADASWTQHSGWHASAHGETLPIQLFQPLLPPALAVAGDASFTAEAAGAPSGKLTGSLELGADPGAALFTAASTQEQIGVGYRGGRLRVDLDDDSLRGTLNLTMVEEGQINATLIAPRHALPPPLTYAGAPEGPPLRGAVRAHLSGIGFLSAFIPYTEDIEGDATLNLDVAGTVDEPAIEGGLTLAQGAARIPALGLSLKGVRIDAHAEDKNNFALRARLASGPGELTIDGRARHDPHKGWSADTHIKGKNFEATRIPELKTLISPDLRLRLAGRRIDLEGELALPKATIKPRELITAVRPSDDVILVRDSESAIAPPWQVHANLRLLLGDDVHFDGFGLDARLGGNVVLTDAPEQPTLARGELRVEEGEYRAYGQRLTIERGRLLFFGGPVSNPGLDVLAVRNIDDVTTGVLARGDLRNPRVTLYSVPAMSDTDALAYLVLGRPLSQATSSEGERLYGAASSLGLAGGGFLASRLGQRFGIEDVRIETGGGFGEGALVIRHYLSPKLYVSYGIGLFEQINVLLLRYQMSKRWALEAESGGVDGADIVYTIDK